MTIQTSAAYISDGDQLNQGYHRGVNGVIRVEAGENIAAGNVVYVHLTDGEAYVSDTATANDIRATGIALVTATAGNDVDVLTRGVWTTSGLTDKEDYYLGVTGAISTTRSGVRVGTALSTTELFVKIIQDDADTVGTIKAWHEDMTGMPSNMITAFWLACDGAVLTDAESPFNGQTLPDLNTTQRFLRGSATTGTTGGADTHNHQWHDDTDGDTYQSDGSTAQTYELVHGGIDVLNACIDRRSGQGTDYYTKNGSTLPACMTVKWIFKIK